MGYVKPLLLIATVFSTSPCYAEEDFGPPSGKRSCTPDGKREEAKRKRVADSPSPPLPPPPPLSSLPPLPPLPSSEGPGGSPSSPLPLLPPLEGDQSPSDPSADVLEMSEPKRKKPRVEAASSVYKQKKAEEGRPSPQPEKDDDNA